MRGVLNDVMEWVSHVFIRHVSNGWLWTEAFLKPIDKVLRIALLLASCAAYLLVMVGTNNLQ